MITNSKLAWKAINNIRCPTGKSSIQVSPLEDAEGNKTSDPKEQAELLATRYHHVSDDSNLRPEFLEKRAAFLATEKGQKLKERRTTEPGSTSDMNRYFTQQELNRQLHKRKKNSARAR